MIMKIQRVTGAGDGDSGTHDPNLGKVVLYLPARLGRHSKEVRSEGGALAPHSQA